MQGDELMRTQTTRRLGSDHPHRDCQAARLQTSLRSQKTLSRSRLRADIKKRQTLPGRGTPEFPTLTEFMALMLVRGPLLRDRVNARMLEFARSTMEEMTATPESFREAAETARNDGVDVPVDSEALEQLRKARFTVFRSLFRTLFSCRCCSEGWNRFGGRWRIAAGFCIGQKTQSSLRATARSASVRKIPVRKGDLRPRRTCGGGERSGLPTDQAFDDPRHSYRCPSPRTVRPR